MRPKPLAWAALVSLLACGRTGLDDLAPPVGIPSALGRDASSSEAATPGPDASARCGDGGPITVAYVLDAVGNLYRYYPSTGQEVLLGTPDCGDSVIPWTMTAGRDHAYIVYTDWSLFRVDLATLACTPTPFVAGQLGLEDSFGVALTGSGDSERIYYYGVPGDDASTAILAVSDTVSFTLSLVGPVNPMSPNDPLFPVNLTSDNAGHLYAYAPEPEGDLLEIDEATGVVHLLVDESLPSGPPYATLAYEGSVYLFADDVVEEFEPPKPGAFSTRTIDAGAIGAGSYVVCP
jgi:hypothetical protein